MLSLKSLRSAAVAALLASASAGMAEAADILRGPAPPPLAPPPVLDAGGGFYLRGDVGIGIHDHKTIDTLPPLAGLRTIDSNVNTTGFVGIGAGYAFNSWLRTDVTGEYRFSARHRHVDTYTGGGNLIKGRLDGFVGLVNAYVDLGTWHRVTPFIGAGIGAASLTMSSTRDIKVANGTVAAGTNKTETHFAWALHAGLGFDITSNWKAELAYRYLHIGDVKSGTVQCPGAPCSGPYHVRIKSLDSHDVKLGLRYMFADAAPIFAPGPLVRKY